MSRHPDIPPLSAPEVPTRVPGSERRRQIVAAAMRCFSDRGFRGTTTRDIAKQVGITEAALYRYFPSKEALYTAIIDEKMAAPDPVASVEEAARRGDDRAVFEGLARAMLGTGDADPSFLRILLYTGLEGHELSAPFFEGRIRRLREFVAGYLARRAREGAFRPLDPILGARAFLGMVLDYLIVREVFHQRETYREAPERVAETFVSVFLDGLRRREGDAGG